MLCKKRSPLVFIIASIPLLGLFPVHASQASPLSPQERRGKQIYMRGESPSGGQIMAMVGDGSVEVPGATLPCANCHGFDGRGKPEAGVVPSDVTWQDLTKSYGTTHASGRKHPAYTARSLARAITDRVDPAGQLLAIGMPRYRMTDGDLADLLSYMRRLGSDQDPGLTRSSISIGTILPGRGPLAEIGQAMQAVMAAFFDDINAQGGVYSRRIQLRAVASADTPRDTRVAVERFLQKELVFGMVSPFMAGAEKELSSLAEGEGLPVVGPFTLFPQVGFPLNRYVFYLLSGLREQALALVDFAVQTRPGENPRVAVILPADDDIRRVGDAIEERGKKRGWAWVTRAEYARGHFDAARLAKDASQFGAEMVFFLGSGGEARAFAVEAQKLPWTASLYLSGTLVGQEIFEAPRSFQDRLFLAYPTLPADQTAAGIQGYGRLAARHNLPARHLAAQLSAYCAAQVLVEGLKRTGRDLSREKLIATLEGLYGFETGLTPPITYGPNRRIGALGAYVLGVNLAEKRFVPASGWLAPEE
jgi:ABC-type branched-subunit amino acid transport system substrate-binding protein